MRMTLKRLESVFPAHAGMDRETRSAGRHVVLVFPAHAGMDPNTSN